MIKPAINTHPDTAAGSAWVEAAFTDGRAATDARLSGIETQNEAAFIILTSYQMRL
jgi:hypothetical protein